MVRRLKLFDTVITSTIYGSGCWTMTVERESRLKVARRRMLRNMAQVIRGRLGDEENSPENWIDYLVRSTRFVES